MKRLILQYCIILICSTLSGQAGPENLVGKVSFMSSQNIYVKFKSTSEISPGDTLFISSEGKLIPVLKVSNLSSTSAVCTSISKEILTIDHLIIAISNRKDQRPTDQAEEVLPVNNQIPIIVDTSSSVSVSSPRQSQIIKGSLSVNSYTDLSNTTADNSQRFRYTFSLAAQNIGDSKFSAETYLSFKHKAGEWEEVKSDLFNALKVYNLSVYYDMNKTTRFSLGRRINNRISSIGPSDGLQVEKTFSHITVGALIGTRPDYSNFGFNSDLLQYGAYLAHVPSLKRGRVESSAAIMQQMNGGKTDRRFLYFQHSNSLIKNLNFFGTFEVDLYKLISDTVNDTETAQNVFDLTGLYLSLSYRIAKAITISGSYDARKNVFYYETYKTYIDRILENEMRQSLILQVSMRITKDILFGVRSGYRFLNSDLHPSKNVYGYLTYSQIPGVNISTTISATYLTTSYLSGYIIGLNLSRNFLGGKVQTGLGYRYVDYNLSENTLNINQNVAEINFSWQLSKYLSFAAYYEGTIEPDDMYNRIYLQARKRF